MDALAASTIERDEQVEDSVPDINTAEVALKEAKENLRQERNMRETIEKRNVELHKSVGTLVKQNTALQEEISALKEAKSRLSAELTKLKKKNSAK